jgi:hypothetical protein
MSESTGGLRRSEWRKASRCQAGECVEVFRTDDAVLVRASARPDHALKITTESWRAFTDAARAGEFDTSA